jgi:hypothetical protein
MRLLGAALFALLSACGGGNSGADTQNSSASKMVALSAPSPAFPHGVPLDRISNSPLYDPSSFNKPLGSISPNYLSDSIVEESISGRKKQGDFSSSPYTPIGWIDDFETRAFVFTYTGGIGAPAYRPMVAPVPLPAPVPVPLVGFAAYKTVAIPNVVPFENLWPAPMSPIWRTFMIEQMACWPICSMRVSDVLPGAPQPKGSYRFEGANIVLSSSTSSGDSAIDAVLNNPSLPLYHMWNTRRWDVDCTGGRSSARAP